MSMSVVQLEDGSGSGRAVRVTDGGAARTEPAASEAYSSSVQVMMAAGSMPLVGSRLGRRQIQIQNLDPGDVIHIALDNAPATVNHVRIDPGVIYEFPPGVSYEGAIEALAPTGDVWVAIIEFGAKVAP
jgi:hypothetical protein